MDNRLLLTVGGLALLGLLLIHLDHQVHNRGGSQRRADWIKFSVFVLIIVSLLIVSWLGWLAAVTVVALISVLGAWEIYGSLKSEARTAATALSLSVFLFTLGHLLVGDSGTWPARFTLVVLLVATTDAFSQLWGRLLGRHKLAPRLSPKKTVEGLLGGMATAASLSCLLGFLLPESTIPERLGLGIITSIAAVTGDLFFSGVKRSLGIKDFSAVLPGSGGILDRFDSLILTAPVFHWSRILLTS
jgi:phosphatidate cytidylyltransferase